MDVRKTNRMSAVSPVARFSDVAPELVRRLGWIVAGLAAVVARRFLKDPKFFALIIPLWSWLGRSGRRFGRVKVQPAVPVAVSVRAVTPLVAKVRTRGVRLPSRRGWLVRALGYEAAGYGCQLQALLAEPELQALLIAVPAAGRILRPLCRMLGVEPMGAVAPVVAAARVRVRRPRPPRVKIKLPGSTRPYICGPKAPVLRRG